MYSSQLTIYYDHQKLQLRRLTRQLTEGRDVRLFSFHNIIEGNIHLVLNGGARSVVVCSLDKIEPHVILKLRGEPSLIGGIAPASACHVRSSYIIEVVQNAGQLLCRRFSVTTSPSNLNGSGCMPINVVSAYRQMKV